jgi:hypothetical protein
MGAELVVVVLANATAVAASSEAGTEFAHADQRYLLVLSTALSTTKGGAGHGRCSHSHALRSILYGETPMEYAAPREDDFAGRG